MVLDREVQSQTRERGYGQPVPSSQGRRMARRLLVHPMLVLRCGRKAAAPRTMAGARMTTARRTMMACFASCSGSDRLSLSSQRNLYHLQGLRVLPMLTRLRAGDQEPM